MKVCPTVDCPTLVQAGYCARCRVKREQQRGTRQQRGYDARYDRERRALVAREAKGERFSCWNCGAPTPPGEWQLGHDKRDRAIIRGPECLPCNLNTSGAISPST